ASAEQLAIEACRIEIERCGEPIGKQDQFAAAFGGFNFIEFNPDESVLVTPILCKRETLERLQERIIVFYTGITRSASGILKTQQAGLTSQKTKQKMLGRMVELAYELKIALEQNNLNAFGEIIHANWELKKGLAREIS